MIAPCLVFLLFVGGGGLALAARFRDFAPLERLALGVGAAVVGIYLAGLSLYLGGADWRWLWLWPAAVAALAWPVRTEIRSLLASPPVPVALAGWLVVALWTLGLHTLVFAYSGGTWAVDWFEHYERALFFLLHWPADHAFVAGYLLPARPPLANLVEAGLLALAGHGFAEYQTTATLLATLVFFPLAALTQRSGPAAGPVRLLVVLLLVHPLFVQNATFPWTKLPAAFFVILAVTLIAGPARPARFALALVALAAGLLTHYSAGPWIIALSAGALAAGAWRHLDRAGRCSLVHGGLGAAVLAATWFGWAAYTYGPVTLASATSTFGHAPDVDTWGKLTIAAANVRYTLVPDWEAPTFAMLMRQPELLGRLRDVAFIGYQVNLPVAFGVGNLCALAWLVFRTPAGPARRFWSVAGPVAVILGLVAHSRLDPLGLAHIALTPLVLLGLAWVAARAEDFPRWLRTLWLAGLAIDLALGVVLHFGLQSLALLRWLHPGVPSRELVRGLSEVAVANFENKYRVQQPYLADLAGAGLPVVAAGLVLLLGFALWRTRSPRSAGA